MTMHEIAVVHRQVRALGSFGEGPRYACLYFHTNVLFMDPAGTYTHACFGGCILHAGFYNHQRPTKFNSNPKNPIVAAACSSP